MRAEHNRSRAISLASRGGASRSGDGATLNDGLDQRGELVDGRHERVHQAGQDLVAKQVGGSASYVTPPKSLMAVVIRWLVLARPLSIHRPGRRPAIDPAVTLLRGSGGADVFWPQAAGQSSADAVTAIPMATHALRTKSCRSP